MVLFGWLKNVAPFKCNSCLFILLQVSGIDPPKPVSSFGHFGFDEKLIKAVTKAGYTQPMPIQAQVIHMFIDKVSTCD